MIFREYQIEIIDKEKEEMGLLSDIEKVSITLDMSEVVAFYPVFNNDGLNLNTVVYLRSGVSFTLVGTLYATFKQDHKNATAVLR